VCCPHLPSAALDLVSPSRPQGGGASTSQGHPRTSSGRRSNAWNLLVAEATAKEIGHVGLAEALELTALIAEKEPTRPGPSAPRKTHSRALGGLMVAGGLEMKLTATGHTSSTAIRARSVRGSEPPPVSLPREGRTLTFALSEVCVTLLPRTTVFTTPRRCEGRRPAVKRTLMLQTHVRATARAGSHSYSPTPQAVIGDSWPPCKWPSRVASEPAPASEADRPVTERRSSVGARPPDPLILSCNPANNELKPGQRQPLPKKPRASSGRRSRPAPASTHHRQMLSAAASTVGLTSPERLGGAARSPIAHISLGRSALRC